MTGFFLHIERQLDANRGPITIAEWKTAVAKVDGLRLQTAETMFLNPRKPEQPIQIPLREGNVEVYFPEGDFWIPAIKWLGGRAKFRAPRVMNGTDPVWIGARKLADSLGAEICGIGGERFEVPC